MPRADLTIEGDSAIVTAAGRGIGRQIVDHLTAAGIDVAINDIDAGRAEDTAAAVRAADRGEAVPIPGDASDSEAMAELVETTVAEFGGLDILVNNVGVSGPTKPCEDITNEEFMGTLSVNLGGMFNATSAAIPHLRTSDAGRIINISSRSGKRPQPNRTPYTTSKMGVIGFTRTLAVELAADDVTVNAICPGVVRGERLREVMESQAEAQGRPYEEIEREFRDTSPKGELTEPEDIADAVLFLCSTRAHRILGQDLNVSAGRIMY